MKIGIVANYPKPEIAVKVIEFVKAKAKKKDTQIYLNNNTFLFIREELQKLDLLKQIKSFQENNLKENLDILLSFGGDGTMLFSGNIALKKDIPLLGVNFGKLGFLADVDYEELDDVLESFKRNEHIIEERIVLGGHFVSPKQKSFTALNDIVIDKGGWSRIIQIETWVNDQYLTTFSSDGLIISTPTGSTGYSLSAGGPILVPESNMFILTPICPHTMTVRPIVIPATAIITVRAVSDYNRITVHADGHKIFKVNPPIEMVIKKSDKTLRVVRKRDSSFFETLRTKLMWGIDLRNK